MYEHRAEQVLSKNLIYICIQGRLHWFANGNCEGIGFIPRAIRIVGGIYEGIGFILGENTTNLTEE
jgi:hypothetical protein